MALMAIGIFCHPNPPNLATYAIESDQMSDSGLAGVVAHLRFPSIQLMYGFESQLDVRLLEKSFFRRLLVLLFVRFGWLSAELDVVMMDRLLIGRNVQTKVVDA